MIRSVSFEETLYAPPPARFEAGTPNIAGAIAFGVALEWVRSLGQEAIAAHEAELLAHGTEALERLPGVRLIGTAPRKAAVLSFVVDGIHPHDLGTVLDEQGVAVRAGHHCAQPVMAFFGVPATVRASFACYNTHDEVDRLVRGIERAQELFA
jgi:cysteine desulfurase/selenocysteine lyase